MANSVIAGIAAHVVSKSGLILDKLDKVQTDAMMHHDACFICFDPIFSVLHFSVSWEP